MQHIELHTVNNPTDANTAEDLGLIEFDDHEFCENCAERVGFGTDGRWIPCVLLLTDVDNEDVVYLLCHDCTQPVLDPGNF